MTKTFGVLLNRLSLPLRDLYKRNPTFGKYVSRAVWMSLNSERSAVALREKIRLLEAASPYTMVGAMGLTRLWDFCRDADREGVEGAFVECGVWKGGCGAVMAYLAERSRPPRRVWLFDSFQGLPEPTGYDGGELEKFAPNAPKTGGLRPIGTFVASIEQVRRALFGDLGLDPSCVSIEAGWFQQTLPRVRGSLGPIAVLRLDADLYASTKCCLENLYDNVVVGGYVIVDDYYGWPGCRRAVDEFLAGRGIEVEFRQVDPSDLAGELSAVYFRKPATAAARGSSGAAC